MKLVNKNLSDLISPIRIIRRTLYHLPDNKFRTLYSVVDFHGFMKYRWWGSEECVYARNVGTNN